MDTGSDLHRHHGSGAEGTKAVDPVCGMTVDPHKAKYRSNYEGRPLLLLQRRVQGEVREGAQALPGAKSIGRRACAGGDDLHLPHASGDPAGWAWLVPDLRHGARAGDGVGRRRAQPRTCRHVPPVLDRPGAHRAGVRAGDGRPSVGLDHVRRASRPRTGCSLCSRRRSCCGPAGRSSSAAGSSLETRNLNMFTLIAMGTGVAWVYSVVATLLPGRVPGGVRAAMTARCRSISRRRPSSPFSFCSGRCWS